MSHYLWAKESRTLEKKLNDKKTNKIKKFYWERDVLKPSKAKKKKKKKNFYKKKNYENNFRKKKRES